MRKKQKFQKTRQKEYEDEKERFWKKHAEKHPDPQVIPFIEKPFGLSLDESLFLKGSVVSIGLFNGMPPMPAEIGAPKPSEIEAPSRASRDKSVAAGGRDRTPLTSQDKIRAGMSYSTTSSETSCPSSSCASTRHSRTSASTSASPMTCPSSRREDGQSHVRCVSECLILTCTRSFGSKFLHESRTAYSAMLRDTRCTTLAHAPESVVA